MIVGREGLKVLVQAPLIEHNYVIQALATNGSDHALNVGALPRRAWCGQHLRDSHRLHLFNEIMAEDPISITQQILRRAVPWKCFPQLLSGPFRSRMRRDREVNDTPALVRQN